MLKFYGLQCNEVGNTDIEITKSDEYQERKQNWINAGNHNYLRITRILTSLRLLGLENYAQAFFKCLNQFTQKRAKTLAVRLMLTGKVLLEAKPTGYQQLNKTGLTQIYL
jgi:hypothetical protein